MTRDMFDRLNSPPRVWNPDEPGQWIAGTVVDLSTFPSQYDPDVEIPVVAIEAEEGSPDVETGEEYEIRGYRTVLRLELERRRPRPGDRLGVAYHGPAEGEDYHVYRVVVEKADRPASDLYPPEQAAQVEAQRAEQAQRAQTAQERPAQQADRQVAGQAASAASGDLGARGGIRRGPNAGPNGPQGQQALTPANTPDDEIPF